MDARRPFWKWPRWKSIGFCLWPPSICIWNWNSKSNLTYAPETMSSTDRRTDGRTDKVNPVYTPSNFVGRGYNNTWLWLVQQATYKIFKMSLHLVVWCWPNKRHNTHCKHKHINHFKSLDACVHSPNVSSLLLSLNSINPMWPMILLP